MRNVRTTRLFFFLFAFALVGIPLLAFVFYKQSNIQKISLPKERGGVYFGYAWYSDHELVLEEMPGIANYSIFDLNSGKNSSLTKLNRQIQRDPSTGVGNWVLSGDGKWLLRSDERLIAYDLEGSRCVEWPQPVKKESVAEKVASYAWQPDSKSWICLIENDNRTLSAVSGSLDKPGVIRTVKNIGQIPDYSWHPALLGYTKEGRVLATIDFGQDSITFFTMDFDKGVSSILKFKVSLPDGRFPLEIALSPDQKRLGWIMGAYPSDYDEFWVSNLYGSGMHKVGQVGFRSWIPMDSEHHPDSLAWSPDGKYISFMPDSRTFSKIYIEK